MTESFRLRHVNWIVGAFLLATLVAILGAILAYTISTDILSAKVRYQTEIEQEELGSLKTNAEVFLLGESVGRVEKIEFGETGQRVILTSKIRKSKQKDIVEGSTVVIRQPLLGTAAHLEILRGAAGGTPIAASLESPGRLPLGDTGASFADVGTSVGQGMQKIVDDFDRARSVIVWAMNALRSLSQTTERGVDPALSELRKAIEELRTTVARTEITLKHTLEDIAETSRTMNERTKSSSENLDSNIEEMQQSIADVGRAATERFKGLQASLDRLNRDVERAVDSFDSVMQDIKKASGELPDTMDNIDHAVNDADDVIKGVKRHPLLRKYVEQDQGTKQTPAAGVRGGTP